MGNTACMVQGAVNVVHFHRDAEGEGADLFFFDVFLANEERSCYTVNHGCNVCCLVLTSQCSLDSKMGGSGIYFMCVGYCTGKDRVVLRGRERRGSSR